MICKHCQTENTVDSRFCKSCTMPLSTAPTKGRPGKIRGRRRKPSKPINMSKEYARRVLHLSSIGVVTYLIFAFIFKGVLPFLTDKIQDYVEEGEITQVLRNISIGEKAFSETMDMVLAESRGEEPSITVNITEDTPLNNVITSTNLSNRDANIYVEIVKSVLSTYFDVKPDMYQSYWSVIQVKSTVEIRSSFYNNAGTKLPFIVHLDTETETVVKIEFIQ